MSRIQFRQKTEEEMQTEAAERLKRKASAPALEAPPSAALPLPAEEAPNFALDSEPEAPKAKKGRRK